MTIWQEKAKQQLGRLLSSNCNPATPLSSVSCKQKDGTSKEVPCPVVVQEYNKYMNGVDHSDQLRTVYSIARRSRKWWTYLFWFFINLSIPNALLLMNESPNYIRQTQRGRPKPCTVLEFRKALAVQLIGKFREGRKRDRTGVPDIHGGGHYPMHAGKKRKSKYCQLVKPPKVSERRYACKSCSDP